METFGQITVAFLSSRIEETDRNCLVPLGRGWNLGGLTDVSGLEDKLVCSFKLAAYMIWGGGSLCVSLTDQHSWKEIWWD